MSIRPVARSANALSLARPQAVSKNIRCLSSTASRRAGHADEHHGDSSADTHETFFSPAMRTTLILTALAVAAYPFLPSPSKTAASPSLSPDAQSAAADTPYITRLLAKYTPSASTWTERNNKHLELTKQAAEDRLLVQEAERPRVWRMRYARAFEQASPHCIPVGSQMDLSDLDVKRD